MIGSAVSIFLRIQDFSETRIVNPPALFWTGFFKPIIGAAFALFVFVAFASGLLNVNSGVDQRFMFLTLGFIHKITASLPTSLAVLSAASAPPR